MASSITTAAAAANFAMPENAVQITSIADGFIWVPWLFMVLGGSLQWIGLGIILVLIAAAFFFFSKNRTAWEKAAGVSSDAAGTD